DPEAQWGADVALRFVVGIAGGVVAAGLIGAVLIAGVARRGGQPWRATAAQVWYGETTIPWRAAIAAVLGVAVVASTIVALMGGYHVFGTDVTGNDVLY